MHQQEDGGTPHDDAGEPKAVRIPRYFIFVGCPGCDQCDEHPLLGWDTLATTADDLEEAREACLQVPDHLWWQLVDIVNGKVILRSRPENAPKPAMN